MSRIQNPTVELLAITLHEQACLADGINLKSWFQTCEEDREIWRALARGDEPLDEEIEGPEPDPAEEYAQAFDNKCKPGLS